MGTETIPKWKLAASSTLESLSGQIFTSDTIGRDELKKSAVDNWEYTPSEESNIKRLDKCTELPTVFEEVTGTHVYPSGQIYKLEDVLLIGPQPIVSTKKGRVVLESVENSRKVLDNRTFEFIRSQGIRKGYRVFKRTDKINPSAIDKEYIFYLFVTRQQTIFTGL